MKTNRFSNLGELHRSLSDEEKSLLQISIKNTYNDFIQHVSEGRNMSINDVDKIGQGRVWTGIRAKNIGLVDDLGGLSKAIELASELAEIKDFKVLEFPKSKNGLEDFFKTIEKGEILSKKRVEEVYLNELKKEFLNMQGIQALLPVKYELN